MESTKLIIEGVTHLWKEPQISIIEVLALAQEDTNDRSFIIEWEGFIDGSKVENGQIRPDQILDLGRYMTEESENTYVKMVISSDGSVS